MPVWRTLLPVVVDIMGQIALSVLRKTGTIEPSAHVRRDHTMSAHHREYETELAAQYEPDTTRNNAAAVRVHPDTTVQRLVM